MTAIRAQGGYVAKQCPVRAQNDVLQPAIPLKYDDYTLRLFRRGNAFEAEVFERLLSVPGVVEIEKHSATNGKAREVATLAAIAAGAPVILSGRLPADRAHRVGEPDILVGGLKGYRAIDVKGHSTFGSGTTIPALAADLTKLNIASARAVDAQRRPDDLMQLAHYQRMLEARGIAAPGPSFGAIIGLELQVVWFNLLAPLMTHRRLPMSVYDEEFALRLRVIQVATKHLKDDSIPLVVKPERISECRACPWADYCREQMSQGTGDLSLIVPKIRQPTLGNLAAQGITTRGDLARMDLSTYIGKPTASLPDHKDRAMATQGSEPVYLRRGITTVEVPHADLEIHYDVENDENGVYLHGMHIDNPSGLDVQTGFQPTYSWELLDPASEAKLFSDFWEKLSKLRQTASKNGKSVLVYVYNQGHEKSRMRKSAEMAGLSVEVEELIASGEICDLLKVFRDQCLTGNSNSLKYVAPLAHFNWDVDEPSGLQSIIWHDKAVLGSIEAQTWLKTYNRGDVEATAVLLEWLSTEANTYPNVSTLDSQFQA